MYKKLTITVEQDIYEGLHRVIGRGSISQFIAELVRPHVVAENLEAAYAELAADEASEQEALEWTEEFAGEFVDAGTPPGSRKR